MEACSHVGCELMSVSLRFFPVRACETTKLGRFRSDLGIFHIDELLIYLIINSESLFVRVRFSGYLSRLVL